jgi:hypothetical protein
MVYQRYTTAVKEGYAERPDVAEQHERARDVRHWLEGLSIDSGIRAELVEQLRALEEGFGQLRGLQPPNLP